jgi:hypothetical protein
MKKGVIFSRIDEVCPIWQKSYCTRGLKSKIIRSSAKQDAKRDSSLSFTFAYVYLLRRINLHVCVCMMYACVHGQEDALLDEDTHMYVHMQHTHVCKKHNLQEYISS